MRTILVVLIVIAIGSLIYLAFRRGWFGSSADVVTQSSQSDITGDTVLQKGTFDQTELKNGVIQLKSTTVKAGS